jgi:hypothetical protein
VHNCTRVGRIVEIDHAAVNGGLSGLRDAAMVKITITANGGLSILRIAEDALLMNHCAVVVV